MDVLAALAAHDRIQADREPTDALADEISPAAGDSDPASPDDFGPGGAALFRSLADVGDPYELTAMIVEAARIKDQLDGYHRMLTGDSDLWFRVVPSRGDKSVLEVKATGVAQEARQLTNVWRQLLAEIRRQKGTATGSGGDDDLDDL